MSLCLKNHTCLPLSLCHYVSKITPVFFCHYVILSQKSHLSSFVIMSFCLKKYICLPPSLCYSVLKTTPSVTSVLLCYPVFLTLSPLSSVILSFKRKQEEKKAASLFLRMGNFNERQAEIIKLFADEPSAMVTIKDLEVKFGVSPTTAKSDIIGLLGENIVSEISLNKVKRAYIKGDGLDEILSKA